mmetsp:Transcript_36978/g.93382  ORF Transcript_36978/g.93382 Transcript_36978/m.93382 type:complete len:269 (+) Transcript_36978:2089-2895(+)
MPRLEAWLAVRLLSDCRLAGTSLPEFCFRQEVFRSRATLLHDARRRVPQRPLEPTEAEFVLRPGAGSELGPLEAGGLKAALEVVLCLAAQTSAPPPGQTLQQYVDVWLPRAGPAAALLAAAPAAAEEDPGMAAVARRSTKGLRRLPMAALCAAYEALEDLAVPTLLRAVHGEYAQPRPRDLHAEVVAAAGRVGPDPCRCLAQGRGRFIGRFLCAGSAYQPGATPLNLYLADKRCVTWGPACSESTLRQVFPDEVLPMHALEVHRCLLE